ncbi:MAG: Hsp20/alpha crystallin family protein [bacterium]|nr:Hsp20/alpha crystallin family protein [bacterium]
MNRDDDIRRLIRDFQSYSEEVDAISRDYFNRSQNLTLYSGRGFMPSLDTFETESDFVCVIELAGVDVEDLSVEFDGVALIISGKRRPLTGFEKRQYLKLELDFGYFERIVTVPEAVKPETLHIENINGFYIIRLKKLQPGFRHAALREEPIDSDSRR